MKFDLGWSVSVLVTIHACLSYGFEHILPRGINEKPMQVIANVPVIDTTLVRAAQAYAQKVSPPILYNHIMRTWLFGALVISHNTTLQPMVDLEVHAIGAMLHDLGFILNATWISPDRRFEVDSAIATTDLVESQLEHHHDHEHKHWDANRLQLLYDSVLLSSEFRFSLYKQATVAMVVQGVLLDIQGAQLGVTDEEYGIVEAAFLSSTDLIDNFRSTIVQLCVQKPATTYDSWQQAFGDAYVPGCSAVGNRFVDIFK